MLSLELNPDAFFAQHSEKFIVGNDIYFDRLFPFPFGFSELCPEVCNSGWF